MTSYSNTTCVRPESDDEEVHPSKFPIYYFCFVFYFLLQSLKRNHDESGDTRGINQEAGGVSGGMIEGSLLVVVRVSTQDTLDGGLGDLGREREKKDRRHGKLYLQLRRWGTMGTMMRSHEQSEGEDDGVDDVPSIIVFFFEEKTFL